jgi:hypothetical protein
MNRKMRSLIKNQSSNKSFSTKYKKGDKLRCIKNVEYDNEILLKEGENYKVDSIEYSYCSEDKGTKYNPFYIINGYIFYSPNETFFDNTYSGGASGKSSYGEIEKHFKSY